MSMRMEIYERLLCERSETIAFNMGLHTAIYVLEAVENLSPEGRKYLLESLKQQIADSEAEYTPYLLRCIS
jgi:hypothetical protein